MGKQKQQVISRFFAPKPKPSTDDTTTSACSPGNAPTPRPKATASVSFSPAKRLKIDEFNSHRDKHLQRDDEPSRRPEPCEDLPEVSTETPNPTKYTPLEQQVVELKRRYPDVLLMIEVGYKYRFFDQDAVNAARVLGIFSHMDHNFFTASIPSFRLNVHVRRLVNAGYKVGVVKQTETAAIKAHGLNKSAPFCRGLSALYTKATLEAAEDLGGGMEEEEEGFMVSSNYLLCVVEKDVDCNNGGVDVRIGAVAVEISAGDVVYDEFDDDFMRNRLEAVVLNYSPTELLLVEPISKQTEKLLSASNARIERLAEELNEADFVQKDGIGVVAMPELAVRALAFVARHLRQFGLERILCSSGASFRPFSSATEMNLSANTLQQLEVLEDSDGSGMGSLLKCMDRTLTTFGSKTFRHWITHPLCDRNMICDRSDAVSEIMASSDVKIHQVVSDVLVALRKAPDIQRGISRIFHRTATTSEFASVVEAISVAGRRLRPLCNSDEEKKRPEVKSKLLRKLILTAASSAVTDAASKFMSSIDREAADKRDFRNLFITDNGNFDEVASARARVNSANESLNRLLPLYRKQLRRTSLKFSTVARVTHLIEVPSDAAVPSDWIKVSSTARAVRYHPPQVLRGLDELALANEELVVVCRAAWDGFLRAFVEGCYSDFRAAVQALASLDCLHSLAVLSMTNKSYVRPVFVPDEEPVQINIVSGRHPVMQQDDSFVPNDTNLHAESEHCQIVTGPNMGGKSCYLRQVGLISLMAQMGSFVPASSATLHVLDGIYTRMGGASDRIHLGRSTFLEELSEASYILRHCTSRSLVIVDELGRGTSTHDGVSIAYAALHYLLDRKRCMLLFVTHYPEIVEIRNEFPVRVGAYHVNYLTRVNQGEEDITYLYKLVPGVSERSYAFRVAQLADLPSSCIGRGVEMSKKLEAEARQRKVEKGCRDILLLLNDALSEEGDDDPERLSLVRNLAISMLLRIKTN
ncbi:hypothetical protein M569_06157 [Genlisea aurea]|uniref:DNA mismatch repair protein MSH3 n=1 Tax=Genlisea aurea TaxID=192259 RepID=S8CPD9_9LAMI|nr:hypothetical protein M569_06157 [Genlisea aurea]